MQLIDIIVISIFIAVGVIIGAILINKELRK